MGIPLAFEAGVAQDSSLMGGSISMDATSLIPPDLNELLSNHKKRACFASGTTLLCP